VLCRHTFIVNSRLHEAAARSTFREIRLGTSHALAIPMKTLVALLPTSRADKLPKRPTSQRWLIKYLWGAEAVGMIGGEPKSSKTWLALQIAVSVASGALCLENFPPDQRGRVLIFAAEDQLYSVRDRLQRIAASVGKKLSQLNLHVITAPTVRLDLESDRDALTATIAKLKPTLVVLDPFVRLHRIDENRSGEVAPLLGYLREVQRRFHTGVILVHHARKGGKKMRGGQALRGSSELHAWGDSNLYLRREDDVVTMSVEHRAAASIPDMDLVLRAKRDALALVPIRPLHARAPAVTLKLTVDQKIIACLKKAKGPVRVGAILKACRARTSTVIGRLKALSAARKIKRTRKGYVFLPISFPARSKRRTGKGKGKT
jgi:hypothetical protein